SLQPWCVVVECSATTRPLDTPRGPKPGGFSVHRRSQHHGSPTGLPPGPYNILRRVLVAVEYQPAVRANVGTHAQRFGHALPTARTVLTGVGGWHGDDSPAGAVCRVREDGPELRPASVRDGLGQVVIADHVGDPQVFRIDHVIRAQEV